MAACTSKLHKSITIQSITGTTVDAHGAVDITTGSNWGTYLRTFEMVISKGGREFWKVNQVNADVSHVWKAQYCSELANATPAMRLVSEGVTYEILSVIDIDLNHREIEIQTKRAV